MYSSTVAPPSATSSVSTTTSSAFPSSSATPDKGDGSTSSAVFVYISAGGAIGLMAIAIVIAAVLILLFCARKSVDHSGKVEIDMNQAYGTSTHTDQYKPILASQNEAYDTVQAGNGYDYEEPIQSVGDCEKPIKSVGDYEDVKDLANYT